ncbi:MAG: hypothetical protein K2G25_04520, partial [Oscillospiraceae bacterium]|nr:hypothetical protein [Oscillospiraceae bacterium]
TLMGEKVANTGLGQAITKENHIYSKKMILPIENSKGMQTCQVNLYDTVGLEVDHQVTEKTLRETKSFLEAAKKNNLENDITIVWFCIAAHCNRFESYEVDLIKELSLNYEIPFVLVLTQCYFDEVSELEAEFCQMLPEIPAIRILAQDRNLRGGRCIKAFGIKKLMYDSVLDYNKRKIQILESKLDFLDDYKTQYIQELYDEAIQCIEEYTNKATKIGFLAAGCIPFIHGLCIRMVSELTHIFGIHSSENFAGDIFASVITGLFATPFMAVPLLSAAVANVYVDRVGRAYLETLMYVVEQSSNEDLQDIELMQKRIREELKKRKH